MNTVAETTQFQKKVTKLLTYVERNNLISYLSFNPHSGTLIEGTGGAQTSLEKGGLWEKHLKKLRQV